MRRVRMRPYLGWRRRSWRQSLCSCRQPDRRGRHGGNAFPAADEAESLIRGRLDGDAIDADAGNLGDTRAHGIAVRSDAGRFAHDGDVEMGDAAAALPHPIDGKRQELVRWGAAPLRIGWRKMRPDIAISKRA